MTSTAISWSPEYAVGHELIDQQHQRLFALLADVRKQAYSDDNSTLLNTSLMAMVDYAAQHFSDEEALMKEVGYPDLTLHKVQHDKLTNQVEDMVDNLKGGEIVMIEHLLLFLTDWLVEHILVEDLAVTKYINSQK